MNKSKRDDQVCPDVTDDQAYQFLFRSFQQLVPDLSPAMLHCFRTESTLLRFTRNTVIHHYRELWNHYTFIVKGFVMTSMIVAKKEAPVLFYLPGDLILAPRRAAYYRRLCMKLSTVEDSICVILDHEKFEKSFEGRRELRELSSQLLLNCLLSILEAEKLQHGNPMWRYNHLLENTPEIIAKLKVEDIARFLGIARETLSRHRSSLARNGRAE